MMSEAYRYKICVIFCKQMHGLYRVKDYQKVSSHSQKVRETPTVLNKAVDNCYVLMDYFSVSKLCFMSWYTIGQRNFESYLDFVYIYLFYGKLQDFIWLHMCFDEISFHFR